MVEDVKRAGYCHELSAGKGREDGVYMFGKLLGLAIPGNKLGA